MYTVLHSLCTLLFVIGQGIIIITLLSVLFQRSIFITITMLQMLKKICFAIDVEIKFHPYHSMHDVNVIK